MTLNNIQYAAIMAVTLTVLLTSQSAFAETITVGQGAGIAGDESIQAAINRAANGDTIIIPDGIYTDLGQINLHKELTLQSTNADYKQDNVIITGNSHIRINSDNVTVAGLEFVDTTHNLAIWFDWDQGVSNVLIDKNSFTNTFGDGIRLYIKPGQHVINATISNNNFAQIGFNAPDGKKPLFIDGEKATQHDKSAIGASYVSNSRFVGNTIDETTWSGMNFEFVTGLTISENTISNVPKHGIQIAKSPDSGVTIADNTITNAAFALIKWRDITPDDKTHTPERVVNHAHGAILLTNATDVTIKDNTITKSRNGIVVCPYNCDATTFEPYPNQSGTSSATVNGNSFAEITTKAIINSVPDYVLDATRNYYGTETPNFDELLHGTIRYSPFWTDKVDGTLKADGLAIQYASAEVDRSPICSITLAHYYLAFDNAAWGETSFSVSNSVLNAGDEVLSGVKITTSGWKDSNDDPVVGAKSLVANGGLISEDPASSGNTLTDDDYHPFLSSVAAGIEYTTDLPKPDTADSFELGFKLDLSERASGPDSEIYETVQYAGTCTK